MIRWEILDRNTDRERAVCTDDTSTTEHHVDTADSTDIGWAYLATVGGEVDGGGESDYWWMEADAMPAYVLAWCEDTQRYIDELRFMDENPPNWTRDFPRGAPNA